MSNIPTSICASCNQPGHSRRTFIGCPLNPRNQVQSDVYVEITSEASPFTSQVRCASCNEVGHSRMTYIGCRFNPLNRSLEDTAMNEAESTREVRDSTDFDTDMEENVEDDSEGEVRDESMDEYEDEDEYEVEDEGEDEDNDEDEDEEGASHNGTEDEEEIIDGCMHCGRPGHRLRTSLLCPLNSRCTRNIAKMPDRVPTDRDDRGSMNITCNKCFALMWIEERAANSSKRNPNFHLCCCQGRTILNPLKPTPQEIADLLRGETVESIEFRKHIRSYNSSLSFTSFGVNLDLNLANNQSGSYTFRIQGSPYHLIGSAVPAGNENPKFSQIYIYDAEHELENRHSIASHVSISTLNVLQQLMHRLNPFVDVYKNMSQIANEQRNVSNSETNIEGIASMENIKLIFRAEGLPDRRRYNRPTQESEIGVIIIGGGSSDDDAVSGRDIVVQFQDNSTDRVSAMNQFYDPLHYVLLFPFGEEGWSIETFDSSGKNGVTVMEYYKFRLMCRPSSNHLLHLYGNLFHQYIVDMYAKLEENRLSYIRHNQSSLRCELYQGLRDAVSVDDGVDRNDQVDLSRTGKKIILPSSFIGGPRHMAQLYQDALSIVRRFGKPDYFITFTCNPKWPEIQRELQYKQKASDRPDLCARVFKLKLHELMDDLIKRDILGKIAAHIYTIEFQKRGLPHAHILLIVNPEDKPQSVEEYDSIISAEIPDRDAFPLAYETVIKNMVHGPCGSLNPHAVCMDRQLGICTKKYPKDFSEETVVNETGGYPQYRRRNNGVTVPKTINGHTFNIDNRWIVPHNLYLCTKYDAHINVELCSSIKSIKYVYKYVYKGHDRASMSVEQNDEIRNFIDARYVSAPEACWRLFSFSLHKEYPAHQRLAIHLQGENPVYFSESDRYEDVMRRSSAMETTLTGWFKMNESDPNARAILYPNFPEKYVWHGDLKPRQWLPRKRGFAIGRIYSISPKQSETYHLRMILYHISGATSFEDLRTVDGVLHGSFQDAARALGLLTSDDQWNNCLQEASLTQTPFSLRKLFCIIMIFCEPSDPYQLWMTFRDQLSEDHKHRLSSDSSFDQILNDIDETAYNNALLDIDDILASQHSSSLTNYSRFVLPTIDTRLNPEDASISRVIREHRRLNAIARSMSGSFDVNNFNVDQRRVYDTLLQSVERDGCRSTNFARIYFLDGPGGTGKTYLFNSILNSVRSGDENGFAMAVASSGTASLLLDGGRTAHSSFKIPLVVSSTTMCGIKPKSEQANLLKQTKIIIWDESSMISKSTLETVDRTFKDIFSEDDRTFKTVPFGGRLIVFGGDFRQVLPVIPKGSRSDIVNQCINRSHLWSSIKVEKLQVNMRVQQAQTNNNVQLSSQLQQFANKLLDIGNGLTETLKVFDQDSNRTIDTDFINISDSMLIPGENVVNLLSFVYPNIFTANNSITALLSPSSLIKSAVLTPTNAYVSEINKLCLEKFPGVATVYYSADAVCDENQAMECPTEFLNSIESGSLPPHVLSLKVGCPIMLLRNLDPSSGLCNGTRLIVKSLLRNVIEASVETGSFVGDIVCIPKVKLISADNDSLQFKRCQFPVRPAFAMTINKAQGQTLDKVGLYLPKPVFSHGQLYVALSRVKTAQSIKILLGSPSSTLIPEQQSKTHTRNVVFKEVFQSPLSPNN